MASHEATYRGPEIMKSREGQLVVVCGVGAIGSILSDHLARVGFKKLVLIDKDRVEASNFASQIYDKDDAGRLKVDAMKTRIFKSTGVSVEIDNRAITVESFPKLLKKYGKTAIFLDCFDNAASRAVLAGADVHCLHLGLASDYCEIVWNGRYRVPKDGEVDVCEYPMARSLSLFVAGIATEILTHYMDVGVKLDKCMTLTDLKISSY